MNGLMMDVPLTITSIMQHAEKVFGDREIVSVTSDNPRHRYTYADAFKRVRKLANALNKLGVEPGDRIATLAWNDYRHFELYYAISCSGLVCHTINPRLFAEQLVFIINQADDQYLFVDPMFVPLLESIAEQIQGVKGFVVMTDQAHMPESTLPNLHCYELLLEGESDTFEWTELDEQAAASMCYTSGTTGNPKGVVYSHRSSVLHAIGLLMPGGLDFSSDEVVMPIVPMFHVNAWGIPYAALIAGNKLVFPGSKMGDGETLVDLINSEGVTVSGGVPTVWLTLVQYLQKSGKRIDSLNRVASGGAATPLSIINDLDSYGVYTHVAWGMTETSPLGTLNARLDREALGEARFAEQRVKVGRPVFGVEIKIVDDENRELPWDGEAFGALKVRGPWVASAYYQMESSASDDGWFDTGDVAIIEPDGTVQITDRSKDVIKSGGEWISSIDLENTAVDHPSVLEAAVVGLYHSKWTERPLLLVVKKEGCEVSREEMLAWFKGKVANWWIPEDCEFIDELPHTATGKISKKDLREQFKDYRFNSDMN